MTEQPAVHKTAVIVEDDPDVRHLLVEVLESAGFTTIAVGNGLDGVRAVEAYQPFLTTLDVNMPGIDGFEAARRIRARSDTFIIMLTGLTDEADAVLGLGAGADDYIVKPFRPREFRARVEALLRRPRPAQRPAEAPAAPDPAPVPQSAQTPADAVPWREQPSAQPGAGPAAVAEAATAPEPRAAAAVAPGGYWLAHRDLQLDPETRIVLVGGQEVELTRTEFDLLATLLESQRRVRSKADLALVVRGESEVRSYFVGEADKRAIEAHMTNLRRKLGDNALQPRYIETVRGVGYRLTADDT